MCNYFSEQSYVTFLVTVNTVYIKILENSEKLIGRIEIY
jgi:hypothetical protein